MALTEAFLGGKPEARGQPKTEKKKNAQKD